MRSEIRRAKNLCGHYVGKPIRVTVNMAGNYWIEPVGWKMEERRGRMADAPAYEAYLHWLYF